jgi:diguanylate cyclase (GGDEF)-like protein/PAS domain S-box-containing protein
VQSTARPSHSVHNEAVPSPRVAPPVVEPVDADPATASDDESAILRLIIEASPSAMLLVDEAGRLTLVNTAAERLFGYSRADLLTTPVDELVPERFRSEQAIRRRRYFEDPLERPVGADVDLYGLDAGGGEFPIEIGLNPVLSSGQVQVLVSVVDISVRKRSDERLRAFVEAAPHAMIMVSSTSVIVLANSEAERVFGYPRDELLSMDVASLFPERFHGEHLQFRADFTANPDRRDIGTGHDLFVRRKDGTEIAVEIGVNPLQILGEQHVLASFLDISGRLQAQAAETAKAADSLRRSILDSLPFSIVASDREGTIVTANPAAEQLLGFDRHELVGSPVDGVRTGVVVDMPLLATRPGVLDEREVDYLRKDGSVVPVNEAIALMDDGAGDVRGFLSVAYDITQRREAETFIRHMAHYDFLTDLPNRTMLFERLDDDLGAAVRTGRSVAVALVDLDHFKRINDSLGHHVGDDVLVQMAARLAAQLRADDMIARLGGDEFVLVFNDFGSHEQLHDRLKAVLASIPEPIFCGGREIIVTATMGVAMSPYAGQDPTMLLKHADTAMYYAKESSRNSFRWFETSMLDETNDKLAMASALRRALDRDELTVYYQPQVSLENGAVTGVEALARWRTADGQDIGPDQFIPVAEDNGLITQLGEWVLRTACSDVVELSERHGTALRLAVNVSPRQFQDRGWLEVLQRALDDSGLPPHRLELEITEGIFMGDPADAADTVARMRSLGVAIAIDDFGTGFSSLAYLTRFPIDKVKIDRSFVSAMSSGVADAVIVDAIIVMAHALGMTVVAEGVETVEQEDYLRERGCDDAQGFRYSRAVPIDALADAVDRVGQRT